jgi:pSer/pThr/pTyr-binding forkhead associated (FHA) protein
MLLFRVSQKMNKVIISRNGISIYEILLQKDSKIWTIGRGAENDIELNSLKISRCHAQIIERKNEDNKFFLMFDGAIFPYKKSKNGIFFEGEKIFFRQLENHDVIVFPDGWSLLFVFSNVIKRGNDTDN